MPLEAGAGRRPWLAKGNGGVGEYETKNLNWSAILSCLYEFDWPLAYCFSVVLLDILVGHFGKMHRTWPVATCYFDLWMDGWMDGWVGGGKEGEGGREGEMGNCVCVHVRVCVCTCAYVCTCV